MFIKFKITRGERYSKLIGKEILGSIIPLEKVEIPLDGDINLRVVTGIEDGCNYQWIPGCKTLGGTMEGIIRQITKVYDADLYDKIISNSKGNIIQKGVEIRYE